MARHTQHFQHSMDELKKTIHSLGALVEEAVERSVHALTHRDAHLAQSVIDNDDHIDRAEVELEEECLKVMALYQPVANDLRWVVSVLKINNDLERIGDLAVNIAERAISLADSDEIEIRSEVSEMSLTTLAMLRYSFEALIYFDEELARKVCAMDDKVDDLNRKMHEHFVNSLKTDPDNVESNMLLLSVSRYLERIADHATNICEDIIYLISGKIVRHRNMTLQVLNGGEPPDSRKSQNS